MVKMPRTFVLLFRLKNGFLAFSVARHGGVQCTLLENQRFFSDLVLVEKNLKFVPIREKALI